jgi:hypothetical protein
MKKVVLYYQTGDLLEKTITLTGMTDTAILLEAVTAYCQRKLKAAEKKQAVVEGAAQQEGNNERVQKVINLYLRICCPPMPPVPAEEAKASSRIGKKILAKPAEYDWERHFRAAASDTWLRRQTWCGLEWLVGKGFSKVAARADHAAAPARKGEVANGNGWAASF